MAKSRTVARSARTGRFVTKSYAKRAPAKTTVERVGGTTKNSRSVNRSASTGKFITQKAALANPATSITQKI